MRRSRHASNERLAIRSRECDRTVIEGVESVGIGDIERAAFKCDAVIEACVGDDVTLLIAAAGLAFGKSDDASTGVEHEEVVGGVDDDRSRSTKTIGDGLNGQRGVGESDRVLERKA